METYYYKLSNIGCWCGGYGAMEFTVDNINCTDCPFISLPTCFRVKFIYNPEYVIVAVFKCSTHTHTHREKRARARGCYYSDTNWLKTTVRLCSNFHICHFFCCSIVCHPRFLRFNQMSSYSSQVLRNHIAQIG